MSPHRSNVRGSLILDREFDGLRLRRASGTHSRAVFNQMNAMLSTFKTQGRHDIWRALVDEQFTPMYAYSMFRLYGVDKIPTANVLAPLGATYDAWRANLECSDEHRKSLKTSRTALAIRDDHILADAPSVLASYREQATGKPSSFNKARVHLLAFLRDCKGVGAQHDLYRQIKSVEPLKTPKSPRRAQLSPDEVRRLVVQMGPTCGPPCWGMASTGMGPKEFWGEWQERPDRLHIEGTKRAGRVRDIPRWTVVTRPGISFSHFKRTLREMTGGKVRPYDFRRAFARWMAESGILEINRKAYMGHGARSMTDLYTFGEMLGQLEGDAEKLRGYTGEPLLTPNLRKMA